MPDYLDKAKANVDAVDVSVLMGRPVVPNALEQEVARITGKDISMPYPDSVKGECASCGREVWIGPRQQQVRMARASKVTVMCPTCATMSLHEHGGSMGDVHNLGNTSHPDD